MKLRNGYLRQETEIVLPKGPTCIIHVVILPPPHPLLPTPRKELRLKKCLILTRGYS